VNLDENLEKAKMFMPPLTRKVKLVNGEEHEYSMDMAIGRSMLASAKASEWLKSHGHVYEDAFYVPPMDDEGNIIEVEGEEVKLFGPDLVSRLSTKDCLNENTIQPLLELAGAIINKDAEWVSNNLREEDIFGVVSPFFLLRLDFWILRRNTVVTAMEEIDLMRSSSKELDTENSLLGASSVVEAPSETSTTSSKKSQSEKS